MLGGKAEYAAVKDMMEADSNFEPMLFEISNISGYMHMKPLPAFTQQCLLNTDVYVMDAWNKIFVWVGHDSNKFEYNAAYRNIDKYIAALKDGRKKEDIMIAEQEPYHEAPMFKVQFPNWSDAVAAKFIKKNTLQELQKNSNDDKDEE